MSLDHSIQLTVDGRHLQDGIHTAEHLSGHHEARRDGIAAQHQPFQVVRLGAEKYLVIDCRRFLIQRTDGQLLVVGHQVLRFFRRQQIRLRAQVVENLTDKIIHLLDEEGRGKEFAVENLRLLRQNFLQFHLVRHRLVHQLRDDNLQQRLVRTDEIVTDDFVKTASHKLEQIDILFGSETAGVQTVLQHLQV